MITVNANIYKRTEPLPVRPLNRERYEDIVEEISYFHEFDDANRVYPVENGIGDRNSLFQFVSHYR